MAYSCKVEEDSYSPLGSRLTSFVITFPRIVLAETVTHRANSDTWGDEASFYERTTTKDISKSSASSRAIPFDRLVEKIKKDPYMPGWTANQKGMQGSPLDKEKESKANDLWLGARDSMISHATSLQVLGVHKQDINRLLEPWCWVTQIVTASRWDNFFALRCHEAAHPAFRTIARMMFLARRKAMPRKLDFGQWHLPFVSLEDKKDFRWSPSSMLEPGVLPDLIKFSAARCGWLSYENHEKDGSPEQMLKTFDRFTAQVPIHAGPVEHQASPLHGSWGAAYPQLRSNLIGWIQARKLLPHEEVKVFDPSEKEIASWPESKE